MNQSEGERQTMADFVRLGIIGIGNQGGNYARCLTTDPEWCPEIKLTAIADRNPARVGEGPFRRKRRLL